MIVALFEMAGLDREGVQARLPRHLRSAVFRILRPVEAATRRLVVIEARDLTPPDHRPCPAPAQPISAGTSPRMPVFRLIDPRIRIGFGGRRFARGPGPRLTVIGVDPWTPIEIPPEPSPDDLVDGAGLSRRLQAVQRALETLPAQARRLARLRGRPRRGAPHLPVLAPMRPGRPPGYRARRQHAVDGVLQDCHSLALMVLHPPDTS